MGNKETSGIRREPMKPRSRKVVAAVPSGAPFKPGKFPFFDQSVLAVFTVSSRSGSASDSGG